jgi:folate-binding protein YgfZ
LATGHLGNPLAEQRAFFAGRAVVALPDHEVVAVSGPDRLVWLNSLSSQLLLGLAPGVTTESLILTPQGRVEHGWLMVDDGDTSWLLVEPGRVPALLAWLKRMVFRNSVTVSAEGEARRVFAYWGDSVPGVTFQPPEMIIWADPWPGVVSGGFAYSGPDHPGAGSALRFAAVAAHATDPIPDTSRAGQWALDAADIRAGRPRLGSEVDDKTLPHEVDWLRSAVHLDKGCYRGQETVAKVHNLGHPPRRLVLLHLDGSASVIPEPGAEVVWGEKTVGYVTRAVLDYEWGPIALALVKRSVAGEDTLTVVSGGESIAATQQVLVAPDAGRVNAPGFSRRPSS